MASPLKQRSSDATMNTTVGVARTGKTFANDKAHQRFSSDFSHRSYSAAQMVDFKFFNNAWIDSFKRLENIGWGSSSP